MRIVEIRETTASIASPIANAYIDFSKMTCSVVAVITDVIRDGNPVDPPRSIVPSLAPEVDAMISRARMTQFG